MHNDRLISANNLPPRPDLQAGLTVVGESGLSQIQQTQ
jgi:hypothetical protein